jgi:histidinol-phosphate aminotransferase
MRISEGPLGRARPELLEMASYEPIEPVDVLAQRLGIPEERILKLDGNENPYGPSPGVAEALASFPYYHIYPDPEQRRVRQALAEFVGLGAEHIVVGNGSDELLDLISRAFLSPGDAVINAPPTFGIYSFVTRLHRGRVIDMPRRGDYGLDLAAMTGAARDGAKLIFLASPNNPTANTVSQEDLASLLDTGVLVVVDEAYAEFAAGSSSGGHGFASAVPWQDNLMVLRTFSKWAGLAGLRVGYGVFPKAIASLIRKIKMPYNMNVAAQAAVLASLADAETLWKRVEAIVSQRQRLFHALSSFPWLRPWPSEANFILCEVHGAAAKGVWTRLRDRGILVRYFDTTSLRHCLRISVGRQEDNDRLLEALAEIGGSLGQ